MTSRKQEILRKRLRDGLLHLRAVCSAGGWAGWWWVLRNRRTFRIGWEQANFLHRVPSSILNPEFEDNDISFINRAFPVHVERLGDELPAGVVALMIEFDELVPESRRAELTWHPDERLRRRAARA